MHAEGGSGRDICGGRWGDGWGEAAVLGDMGLSLSVLKLRLGRMSVLVLNSLVELAEGSLIVWLRFLEAASWALLSDSTLLSCV